MLVGGELPYPHKDFQGKEVVAFKEYGTRFDVLPQILSSDRIHLDFRLRVSEPDNANGVQVGDQKLPALKTRETEMGLDLRPGQTIALGGLVEQRTRCAAPAAVTGEKRDASGARGEAGAVVEEFQLFVPVKAELVSNSMMETVFSPASAFAMKRRKTGSLFLKLSRSRPRRVLIASGVTVVGSEQSDVRRLNNSVRSSGRAMPIKRFRSSSVSSVA